VRRIPGLSRIRRAVQPRQVEEAATCARALTALYGRMPDVDLLHGGASRLPRAVLTARVLQELDPCPWPWGLSRQLDPADPAFLPPLGLHPLLVARDRTLLGLPGHDRLAWVDPAGWCGVGDGPAVTVWFGDAQHIWTVRGPGRPAMGVRAAWPTDRQQRGLNFVSVSTHVLRDGLGLELTHFPVVLEGRVALALHARVTVEEGGDRPVRLGFAIRPATFEGVAPIFHLERTADGLWVADGHPVLAVAERGDELLCAVHGEADPWTRLTGDGPGGPTRRLGPVDRRCPVGLARALELYRGEAAPGSPFSRLVIVAPPKGIAPSLVRTTGRSLWGGAQADRQGLLRSGCELQLRSRQAVLEAARMRLLIAPASVDLGGVLAALALARLGFSRRGGQRIAAALARVRRDGSLPDADAPETGAVLAWAAAEFLRWTDARTVAQASRRGWSRLVDALVDQRPEPGGFGIFGSRGSRRWTAMWRAAALVGAASALRDRGLGIQGDDLQRWALAGAEACEALDDTLGAGPWRSDRDRAPDGSSAAMLAAVWLGVLPAQHRGVRPTLDLLADQAWHGGGVLLRGGAHVAATALFAACRERVEPGTDAVDLVGALASGTGALPTARHPSRGALGEGDDLLSAALFTLLAAERVRASGTGLRVHPGVVSARRLPTPFGPVDIDREGGGEPELRGRWWGSVPEVQWRE